MGTLWGFLHLVSLFASGFSTEDRSGTEKNRPAEESVISLSMADETESGLMLMIWLKSLFQTRLVATNTIGGLRRTSDVRYWNCRKKLRIHWTLFSHSLMYCMRIFCTIQRFDSFEIFRIQKYACSESDSETRVYRWECARVFFLWFLAIAQQCLSTEKTCLKLWQKM